MALIDTGSAVSAIKIIKLPNKCFMGKIRNRSSIRGINGSELKVLGQVEARIGIEENNYEAELLVVPNKTMRNDVILGRDFLIGNKITSVELGEKGCDKIKTVVDVEELEWLGVFNIEEMSKDDTEELEVGDDELTKKEKYAVVKIFKENYSEMKEKSVVPIKHMVRIRVKESKPVYSKMRRLSRMEQEAIKENVEELLKEGIIRKSDSEYASRIVLVKKKDGKLRMCVDYRKLNEIVEKERHPMPIIEDVVQKLQGKRYFTSLDLKNGFYHVDIEEESRKYTAFMTPQGQYEYNKLPFGFANAPAAFIKYMEKVFREFTGNDNVVCFMDDIVVATETLEEHKATLKLVLYTLAANKVRLQLKKCNWLKTTIDFLGYRINGEGITPGEHHIETIKNYPRPSTIKQVQRFIGLASYFRRFILNFKDWASPLLELMKEKKFKWEAKHEEAFNELRGKLIEKPVLRIFSYKAETELHTDASAGGFGAVLLQRNENDKQMYPVSYFSKKTTKAEQKLHSFELETLAVVYSLQRFRSYLFGMKFKLITDCSAMQMTLAKRDVSPKIERWALWLAEFDFTIEHRKGERMKHADALSRIDMLTLDEIMEEDELEEEEEKRYTDDWRIKIVVMQMKDGKINKLKNEILLGNKKGYEVRDNVVYRKDGDRLQLVIPETMVGSVIFQMHDGMGHMGEKKTYQNIRRNYFFGGMKEAVKNHISKCLLCLKFNNKSGRKEHKLHLYRRVPVPFDTVHIDHLGPLEKTKRGYRHILAIVDAFTKYIKLYPTKTTNTKEAIKAMDNYSEIYGYPRRVVSDRGTAFSAEKFKEWGRRNEVIQVEVATACPRANGQVERFNRTMVPILAKLVNETGKEWCKLLKKAEFIMNNMVSSTTGDTPARLLFGVDQRFGQKFEIDDWMDIINEGDMEIQNRRVAAKINIDKAQDYNKEYYDKKIWKEEKFNEGDLVLLKGRKMIGQNSKLYGKFKGPYRVEKVLGRDRYLVSDIVGMKVGRLNYKGILDTERMKLYEKNEGNKELAGELDEEMSIDIDEFDISNDDFNEKHKLQE